MVAVGPQRPSLFHNDSLILPFATRLRGEKVGIGAVGSQDVIRARIPSLGAPTRAPSPASLALGTLSRKGGRGTGAPDRIAPGRADDNRYIGAE